MPRRSALPTGSANFTHHNSHDNLNNVFAFHDARVCREYANEFLRLALGQFGRGRLGDVPKTIDVNGVRSRSPSLPTTRLSWS
jgi:phosphatidylserine/phosphatidylglycerophosphate/cardiolipin synthase-like enzyme